MQVGMGFVSMYFSPMRVINFLCEAFACICNRKIVWSRNALPLHSLSLRNENYLMHFFVSIHTSRCFVSVWFNSKRRDHLPPSPVTFQLSGIYCQYSIGHGIISIGQKAVKTRLLCRWTTYYWDWSLSLARLVNFFYLLCHYYLFMYFVCNLCSILAAVFFLPSLFISNQKIK